MQRELCLYTRYFWKKKNLICVYARTDKFFASMQQYLRFNAMCLSHLSASQRSSMDELIVAASLAAASQMERDYWGWTLRLPFAAGDRTRFVLDQGNFRLDRFVSVLFPADWRADRGNDGAIPRCSVGQNPSNDRPATP